MRSELPDAAAIARYSALESPTKDWPGSRGVPLAKVTLDAPIKTTEGLPVGAVIKTRERRVFAATICAALVVTVATEFDMLVACP